MLTSAAMLDLAPGDWHCAGRDPLFLLDLWQPDGASRNGVITIGSWRNPKTPAAAACQVGTAATVKGNADRRKFERAVADVILGNTYHLMLRPGAERIARLGGLHRFSGWERPILTDSGVIR